MATLTAVFGTALQIGDMVKDFDFSQISLRDDSRNDYLHVQLAPSLGSLTKESIRAMDENLKVIIAGTTREIAKVPPPERTWQRIMEVMGQNLLLEPLDDGISRSEIFLKNGTNFFKFSGAPDPDVVSEVKTWFTNLIKDEDILQSTRIDIEVLGRIVAQTGATITSFENFFAKSERHEQTMVDIGVLRYPDVTHPYFKVYRIKLTAWSDCSRVIFVQDDSNGITGDFSMRKYKPRDDIIAAMSEAVKQKAVSEAESIFN